ncbi:HSP20-like chaperone [Auriscalpium vulgare]|uniref:HSP20-like chaperone n=1 Tax=Auriscalpium vulgare TaxID=40419 RepID=A0ACB8S504_9AGAM|nr:HSP20-like chaperone [Auriscalpium vulgare]
MSLARQFLREFRPLFRMLEEPLGRHTGFAGLPARTVWDDPLFAAPFQSRPAVDVSEVGDQYVVEAELPGVKKEDLEVHVGDGGRSITIEGRTGQKNATTAAPGTPAAPASESENMAAIGEYHSTSGSTQPSNQISIERSFTGSSTFMRTIWLPRPVNARNVSAKLADGILTLRVPKAVESNSVRVDVD